MRLPPLEVLQRVHFVIRCEECGVQVGTAPRPPAHDRFAAMVLEHQLVAGAAEELRRTGCRHGADLQYAVFEAARRAGEPFFFARVDDGKAEAEAPAAAARALR